MAHFDWRDYINNDPGLHSLDALGGNTGKEMTPEQLALQLSENPDYLKPVMPELEPKFTSRGLRCGPLALILLICTLGYGIIVLKPTYYSNNPVPVTPTVTKVEYVGPPVTHTVSKHGT